MSLHTSDLVCTEEFVRFFFFFQAGVGVVVSCTPSHTHTHILAKLSCTQTNKSDHCYLNLFLDGGAVVC